jgi:sialic acid synthase SpsE
MQWCDQYKIGFLTTCFDLNRVEFLASLGLKTIKVGSPDCNSFRLLEKLMKHFDHLIISTGMSTDDEVKEMINFVKGHKVTVLHCVSLYPTPLEKVNLERMNWLRTFGLPVGFSDHSLGTEAGKLAIAMGAEILEKHFTLSRNLPGKDQAMSTLPEEFAELVEWAKLVEKMRGVAHPGLSDSEIELRKVYIGKWGDNR